jgi:tetratricopeptide (TPR) repeat protein
LLAASHATRSSFPDLQAKTPAEYDAYLDVLDGPVLEKGALFERAFPESSLRLPVCELMAREWRSLGKRAEAIDAAERGLSISPDYIPLLVEVADLLANGSQRLGSRTRCRPACAHFARPGKSSAADCARTLDSGSGKAPIRAHTAVGIVRFKRDDRIGAMHAFQGLLLRVEEDDPTLHYRLGRLYAVDGQIAKARRELEQAMLSQDEVASRSGQEGLIGTPVARSCISTLTEYSSERSPDR